MLSAGVGKIQAGMPVPPLERGWYLCLILYWSNQQWAGIVAQASSLCELLE